MVSQSATLDTPHRANFVVHTRETPVPLILLELPQPEDALKMPQKLTHHIQSQDEHLRVRVLSC